MLTAVYNPSTSVRKQASIEVPRALYDIQCFDIELGDFKGCDSTISCYSDPIFMQRNDSCTLAVQAQIKPRSMSVIKITQVGSMDQAEVSREIEVGDFI